MANDDDLELIYTGAGWYDPVGGFVNIDRAPSSGNFEQYPMMFNRYAYATSNPYRFVDPDGGSPVLVLLEQATKKVYNIGFKTTVKKPLNGV